MNSQLTSLVHHCLPNGKDNLADLAQQAAQSVVLTPEKESYVQTLPDYSEYIDETSLKETTNELANAVKAGWQPNTPTFRCYADYAECRVLDFHWSICAPALWLCCTQTLIPAIGSPGR
jgi:hypothetical protein